MTPIKNAFAAALRPLEFSQNGVEYLAVMSRVQAAFQQALQDQVPDAVIEQVDRIFEDKPNLHKVIHALIHRVEIAAYRIASDPNPPSTSLTSLGNWTKVIDLAEPLADELGLLEAQRTCLGGVRVIHAKTILLWEMNHLEDSMNTTAELRRIARQALEDSAAQYRDLLGGANLELTLATNLVARARALDVRAPSRCRTLCIGATRVAAAFAIGLLTLALSIPENT